MLELTALLRSAMLPGLPPLINMPGCEPVPTTVKPARLMIAPVLPLAVNAGPALA